MRDASARSVFLGLLALLLVAGGCMPPRQYYLSENYVQLLAEPLSKVPRPLARDVHYTWLYDASPHLVHHFTDTRTEQQVRARSFSVPTPSRRGSELFQRKADMARADAARATTAADRKIHRDNAVAYSHASEASLRSEMAMERAAAALGVLDATMGLFAAVGEWANEYFRKEAAQTVGIVLEDTGAVGPDASAGTVLYLQFVTLVKVKEKGVINYLMTATLDRGQGRVFRSERLLDIKYIGPPPPAGSPPPAGFVAVDWSPYQSDQRLDPGKASSSPVEGTPPSAGSTQFPPPPDRMKNGSLINNSMILMAHSAVAELYRQQAASEGESK